MPIEVLLVEDNPGDIQLMEEAFHTVNPLIFLHIVRDGVEAMAFLRRQGPYVVAPRPDLVLLDLNLPKMDGREVLAHIKLDDELKTIPTVVVTSSQADADIAKSYELHANSYITKPMQFDAFLTLVKSISDFWLTHAKAPPRRNAAVLSDGPRS